MPPKRKRTSQSSSSLPTSRATRSSDTSSTDHSTFVQSGNEMDSPAKRIKGGGTNPAVQQPKPPRTFRLSLIPVSIEQEPLRRYLNRLECRPRSPNLQPLEENILNFSLASYLSWQVATVSFRQEPAEFNKCIRGNSINIGLPMELGGTQITVDCDFYGMTPLYHPQLEVEPEYDLIAVCGLSAHAFGSWKAPGMSQTMWLRDILPLDFPRVRVFTWGYKSDLREGTDTSSIADFSRQLLIDIHVARDDGGDEELRRPIILVGHSVGGLVIKQALLEAAQSKSHNDHAILRSCVGLLLFGVPNRGLNDDNLLSLVKDKKNEPFVRNLIEGAAPLHNLHVAFARKYEEESCLEGCSIASFYETRDTPTVMKTPDGTWSRTGPLARMVTKDSAIWFVPQEEAHNQIAISADHSKLVKFEGHGDHSYHRVRSTLKDMLKKAQNLVEKRMGCCFLWPKRILKTIDDLQLVHIREQLEADNKDLPSLSSFDWEDPKYYWVAKNIDFTQWCSSQEPCALLISGPSQCGIDEIASHLIGQSKLAAPNPTHSVVLHFFCSMTAAGEQSVSAVKAFISQVLCSATSREPSEQNAVIDALRGVLRTMVVDPRMNNQGLKPTTIPELLHQAPEVVDPRMKNQGLKPTTIPELLHQAPEELLWDALQRFLDTDQVRALTIVFVGLDKPTPQNEGFIEGVYSLIKHLLKRPTKCKVLLTCKAESGIKERFPGITHIEYDVERKAYLTALQFDNTRLEKISMEHDGSLQWLWTHDHYLDWSKPDRSRILHVLGKPGSGKSTLTKFLMTHLREREPDSRTAVTASFFYSYREGEAQRSHRNMLRTILHDILRQDEHFFYHFQHHFRRSGKWDYDTLKAILRSMRKHERKVRLYLVIDAVDESTEEDRRDIIQLFFDLCSEKHNCIIKAFVASRPVVDLEHQVTLRKSSFLRMQDVNAPDIQRYVHDTMDSMFGLGEMIKQRVIRYVLEHAQGVFLWGFLVMHQLSKYVERGFSEHEVFCFLESLPKELDGLYRRIWGELANEEENSTIRKRMFQLSLFSGRPLTVLEFQHALAIADFKSQESPPASESFERRLIQGIEKRIINCSGNLLELKDNYEPVVQVMHQTVREFMLQPSLGMIATEAHTDIAKICIQYLRFWAAQIPRVQSWLDWSPDDLESYVQNLEERPLLKYTLEHLKEHLDKSSETAATMLKNLVFQFFESLDHEQPAYSLLESSLLDSTQEREPARRFKDRILQFAVSRGLSRAADLALTAGARVDTPQNNNLLLSIAGQHGYEATIRVLLKHQADAQAKGTDGRTALHLAAQNGSDATVEVLLNHGLNIEATTTAGHRTALHLAAKNGRDAVVRILLKHGAKIEATQQDGFTALYLAAKNGHDAVVQTLLKHGAKIKATQRNGFTALHLAANNGHDSVVQTLLKHGAKMEATQWDDFTALHLAANNGHDAVVQTLLKHGAKTEAITERYSETALHLAANKGNDAVVQTLLKHGAKIEATRWGGFTALHLAAENGHDAVVQTLLKHGAKTEAITAYYSETALHLAAENGHDAVVQILLKHGAKIEATQRDGFTALHLTAKNRRYAIFHTLLKHGANIEARDNDGCTALQRAAEKGENAVIQLLRANR